MCHDWVMPKSAETPSDAASGYCQCGISIRGLRLPGIDELPACPEGFVDGAVLARFLGSIDPAELLTDGQVLDLVGAWGKVTSWSQARGLRAVAEFARRPESHPSSDPLVARAQRQRLGGDARWHTEAEIGAALSVSPGVAEHRLMLACQAAEKFPATLAALESGAVDQARLDGMVMYAGSCDVAAAALVERAVLAGGDHGSAAAFRRAVRREAARLDPEGTSARAGERRADRFVRSRPEEQDASSLEAYLPVDDAAAVIAVVEAAAQTMAARAGEDRTKDQLEAAAFAAPFWAALGSGELATPEGPVPLAAVGGVAPAVTMTVDAEGVADLRGYGPVSSETAASLVERRRDGRWPVVRVQRGYDDEAAKQAARWPVEEQYRPSAELRRLVHRRDQHCRFPGCTTPAELSDIDHTTPWPDGPTHPANLAVLCRRHHRVKQAKGFAVEQVGDGTLRWTMPTGHIHTTSPPG
jgi:hypothetical protein